MSSQVLIIEDFDDVKGSEGICSTAKEPTISSVGNSDTGNPIMLTGGQASRKNIQTI